MGHSSNELITPTLLRSYFQVSRLYAQNDTHVNARTLGKVANFTFLLTRVGLLKPTLRLIYL